MHETEEDPLFLKFKFRDKVMVGEDESYKNLFFGSSKDLDSIDTYLFNFYNVWPWVDILIEDIVWLFMANLIWLVLVIVFWFNWDPISENLFSDSSTSIATTEKIKDIDINNPVYKVNVDQILNEFERNSITAEDKYMYKPIEVHGYIGSIDDSVFSEKNVSITFNNGEEYTFESISCDVPRSASYVRALSKNMHVAVRGVVVSEEFGVTLNRCAFYSFSQRRWL